MVLQEQLQSLIDDFGSGMEALAEEYGWEAVQDSLKTLATIPSWQPQKNSSNSKHHQHQQPQDEDEDETFHITTTSSLATTTTIESSSQDDSTTSSLLASDIMDASLDAMIVTNEAGVLTLVNSAARVLFGFPNDGESMVGTDIATLIGGTRAEECHNEQQQFKGRQGATTECLQKMMHQTQQVKGWKHGGSEFPVQVRVERVPDKHVYVAVCHDLTEAEHDHELIEREEHLNQTILNSSFDAIAVTNEHGKIIKVNASLLDIFEYETEEQVMGLCISELVIGTSGHEEIHSKQDAQHRHMAQRKDGSEFPCRIGVRKVDGTDMMVGYIHDITHEVRAVELAAEKHAAEELLVNMLPRQIVSRLKEDPSHIADSFHQATVLFGDIVGFTKLSNTLPPVRVVQFLNSIFSRFDKNLDRYGLNKVKTIGDCYMVTSVPNCNDPPKTCAAVCHFAMDMIREIDEYNKDHPDLPLQIRIGINTGPIVAGVVGTKRFLYDIWGDAVNVASRMESTGVAGKVQVTQSVVDTVKAHSGSEFNFEKRGAVQVKGIGEMETFFITKRDSKALSRGYWRRLRSSVAAPKTRSILELLKSVDQLDTDAGDEDDDNEGPCFMSAPHLLSSDDERDNDNNNSITTRRHIPKRGSMCKEPSQAVLNESVSSLLIGQ